MKNSILSIDSVGVDDVSDLFDAMCKDILHKMPNEVKRKYLFEDNVSDVYIRKYVPTLNDVANIIKLFDIKCEIKLFYVEATVTEEFTSNQFHLDKNIDTSFGQPKEYTEKVLEKQERLIEDDELKALAEKKKIIVDVPEIEERTIDPNDIPEPTFL